MNSKSADEQPKEEVAKRVISSKRRYFVPEHGISVEADSPEEAAKAAAKLVKQEDGDAK